MHIKRRIISIIVAVAMVFTLGMTSMGQFGSAYTGTCVTAQAAESNLGTGNNNQNSQTDTTDQITTKTGLVYENGSYHFYQKNGTLLVNALKYVDGNYYYFDKNGDAVTSILKSVNGHTYYFGKNGQALCNILKKIGGYRYYFDEKGRALISTLKKIDGSYYYFGKTGKALTYKLKKINGSYYYFGKIGRALKSTLKKINDHYYYLGKSGKAVTSKWKTINGQTYYFGKTGKALTGKHTVSHYMAYFNNKGQLTRRIDKNKKMVAVTYDDGPSVNTPVILSTLKKYGGVATFFVVGERVKTYAKYIKQASKQGCEIGNHTYNHKILTSCSDSVILSQISSTSKAVKKYAGVSISLLRPPGGGKNSHVASLVGMPMILWNIDTLDWKTQNAASTISCVKSKVKDGDIILMHDLYSATATASKTIIPWLTKQGYQLVTVSELADCKGVTMQKGGSYFCFH